MKIGADGRAEVMVTITDGQGKPFALIDLDANSVKFTIAAVKADNTGATNYFNYILTKVSGKDYVLNGETKKPALAETLQPTSIKAVRSNRFAPVYSPTLSKRLYRPITIAM